ncbi:MAG: 16S rRNA (cytidine(1402)-2'-O)-methyltransferase [Acidobacteria bacterium]|nr:16S rRNA (cytidine(1402)-2'-O)-methyltransferase [Acidobacteriota bacterium]
MSGILFVVSTPIGNLADLSPRARDVLASAAVVACEDTRRTGRLLAHCGIKNRLLSLHEHNEASRVPSLVERLAQGDDVALVSDAGTPLLCDPGFLLVREAAARGVTVRAVPGPSAVLAALAVSGLPPYPFTFGGFVPRKAGKRRTFFAGLADLGHTSIAFESPHRIQASLEAAAEVLDERPVVLCRELTKLHEEVLRGTASTIADHLEQRASIKGEIVLVIGPPDGSGSRSPEA